MRRAANYYKLIRCSFSGAGKSFGGKPCNIRNFFADIWRCSRRLENVVIENKDFESLLAQYDRPDAFFYCDPPYYNAECYEVEFPKRDHLRLCSAIKRCHGFAMVSYNFCAEILDIYKDFYIFRTKRPNSMQKQTALKVQRDEIQGMLAESGKAAAHIEQCRQAAETTPSAIAEWDEALIRQVVESVTVETGNEIIVALKSGTSIHQELM